MAEKKPEREARSYEDFSYRFQLANLLPTGKRGVIFVGNSRAGKSTLACAAAGSDLDILYDGDEEMTFLKPTLQKY